jgi:hypothetical protein
MDFVYFNRARDGIAPPITSGQEHQRAGGGRTQNPWKCSGDAHQWSKVARHYVLETLGKEMAGYSKTPLAQKLGIKPETKVITLGAPANYRKWLTPLPKEVSFSEKASAGSDFVHLFVTERRMLEKELRRLRCHRYYGGRDSRCLPAARAGGCEGLRRR